MTDIVDVARRVQYTGNGTAGPFSFSFQVNANTEIKVYVGSTLKTITTHYTVSLTSSGAGSISFTTGNHPTSSQTITIVSAVGLARSSVYTTGGPLTATALEADFDTNIMITQQSSQKVDRALAAPEYDATSIDMTLPTKDDRKGKYLAFNSTSGNPEVGPSTTDVTTLASVTSDIATLADLQDGTTTTNGISTLAGISSNITTVAGISSNVTTVAGISSDVTTVAGKASLITSDFAADMALVTADFVADVNTLATSNIVDDLNILATSDIVDDMALLATSDNVTAMGNLGDSTVVQHMANLNGSNVISNIATVATNTENVNKFANRYRIESSAPTSSLDAGDLYFNTTTNKLSYYDGSAWKLTGESAERTITTHTVTSAGTQTISASYTVGLVDVYLNGVKLSISSGDATASNGSSVVVTNAAINDIIEIVALSPVDVATLGTASNKNVGIANNNIPIFTSGVADNDYLKVDGTTIEGRDASQVLSDIGAAALAGATFTGGIKEQSTAGALSNSNQTLTLDLSLSNNFTLTTAAAISNFVVNNHTDGQASIFTLRVTYSNSSHDITWTNTSTSVSVKWSGGTAPTQSDSGTDLYVFFADASSSNVPTTIYGFTAGQALA